MVEFYGICWDFDGVLHPYSRGYQGKGNIYDPPTEECIAALNTLRAVGTRMIVCTAREPWEIMGWLTQYGLDWLPVTNVKPIALIYPDDRGYRFDGDFTEFLRVYPQLIGKTLEREKERTE